MKILSSQMRLFIIITYNTKVKVLTNFCPTETRTTLQEPDPVRPALRGRGAHGVQRLHAAAAKLQTAVAGLRRRQAQVFHYAHLPAATAGVLR